MNTKKIEILIRRCNDLKEFKYKLLEFKNIKLKCYNNNIDCVLDTQTTFNLSIGLRNLINSEIESIENKIKVEIESIENKIK